MNAGTQYEDNDASTQTPNLLEAETITSILELANMFLHSSYWFLVLSITLTRLDLSGLAWAAKQRDLLCRESATTIYSWILGKGGKVQLADIAVPVLEEKENPTAENLVKKWDQLDKWLETKMEQILLTLGKGDDTGLGEMLRNLMWSFKNSLI